MVDISVGHIVITTFNVPSKIIFKATSRENLAYAICEQQIRRSASLLFAVYHNIPIMYDPCCLDRISCQAFDHLLRLHRLVSILPGHTLRGQVISMTCLICAFL